MTTAMLPSAASIKSYLAIAVADVSGAQSASSANANNATTPNTTLPLCGNGAANSTAACSNTGTGSNVLATSPTLVTPNLGTPSAAVLTNGTGLPLGTGVTGTLQQTNLPTITASTAGHASLRQYLPATRLAIAKVLDGTADMKLLAVGDSTTFGNLCTNYTTYPSTCNWTHWLVGILNSNGIPAAEGMGVPPSSTNGGTDNRWTVGTGWSLGGQAWGTASSYLGNSPSGSLVYSPHNSTLYDSFDVYYLSANAVGTYGFTATGGTAVNVTTSTSSQGTYKATAVAGSASASNTLTVTCTGKCYVIGIEPFNSTVRRVRVATAGMNGSASSNWTPTGNFSATQAMQTYAPDLFVTSLGINDAGVSQTTANFNSNMTTLIAAQKAIGSDVILMSYPPSSITPNSTYEPLYIPYLSAIAAANNLAFIDTYNAFGAVWQTTLMGDPRHPNDYGYIDWARSVAAFLLSVN